MQAALDAFADENGMTIIYTGSRDFEAQIGTLVAGRQPARHRHVPAAGSSRRLRPSGDALPLPDDVVATVERELER